MRPKFLLLWLPLISICFSASSQPYQSIFSDNGDTYWVFSWQNLSSSFQDTARVEKDTIVNGITYKKVVTTDPDLYPGGLLRENTSTGEVWYRDLIVYRSPEDTVERLAFQFALQQGDTFDISNTLLDPGTYPDSFNVVDSVRVIDGLKHIYFKGMYGNEPFTIIEGIGSNVGIIWKHLKPTPMMSGYLLCSYKNGSKTSYKNRRYNGNCNVPGLGVEAINSTDGDILLYPHPANNLLRFKFNSPFSLTRCTVYNLVGRSISEYHSTSITEIDLRALPNGHYFLKLLTSDGQSILKKFVKE